MKAIIPDLIGKKFGHWTVIGQAETRKNSCGRNMRYWTCQCDCDNHTSRNVLERSLISGASTSCGCQRRDTMVERERNKTHGMTDSRLYRIHKHMMNRCYYKKDVRYECYGGRGISVCEEWHSFELFMQWALQHGCSDELSIDRIDVDGDYSPSNCRWCSVQEQANNKRSNRNFTYLGETHTIAEWAEKYNLNYKCLWKRLHDGWDIERALST